MIHESIPACVDYQSANTRMELQGNLNSCMTFGITSALEMMADRAGQPQQLSPRFLWFYRDQGRMSVDGLVATVNRVGLCKDELCPYIISKEPPYTVQDADTPPSLDALLDAQRSAIKVRVQRIAGKESVMRALATGHAIVSVRVNPSGTEHCEAIIGYDADKGMKIHGSGYCVYWEPWDSLPLVITQLWQITDCPWAPVPHPDYVEGDVPEFSEGVLTIPLVTVYPQFPAKAFRAQNVQLRFSDFGVVETDSGSVVWEHASTYSVQANRLALPALVYAGQRYYKVSLTKPTMELLHYETAAA